MFAEFLSTTIFVFVSATAVSLTPFLGELNVVLAGLATGLSIYATISAFDPIDAGQTNPFVVLIFFSIGIYDFTRTILYILTEIAGSLLAGVLLLAVFGSGGRLGTPLLGAGFSQFQGFAFEIIATTIVITVVLTVSKKDWIHDLGLPIGLTVAVVNLIGTAISGAAFNPVRHFGPAVVSVTWEGFSWIYYAGPAAGALLAFILNAIIFSTIPSKNPEYDVVGKKATRKRARSSGSQKLTIKNF